MKKCRILFPYSKAKNWPVLDRKKYNSPIDYFKDHKKPRGKAYKRLARLEALELSKHKSR